MHIVLASLHKLIYQNSHLVLIINFSFDIINVNLYFFGIVLNKLNCVATWKPYIHAPLLSWNHTQKVDV